MFGSKALAFHAAASRGAAHRASLVVVAAALLLLIAAPTAQAVCYVDAAAAGANSGASWHDAYASLQSALQNGACSEVWVRAGLYKPSASDPAASFAIPAGSKIYGGFAGGETHRDDRDATANVTVLSGDLGGNDSTASGGIDAGVPGDGSNADNSTHVLSMNGSATSIGADTVLDGFVVTAGNAANANVGAGKFGGGLFCSASGYGGHECSPTLAHLVFSGNHAASQGGAIYEQGYSGATSNPAFSDVVFIGNSAGASGGAIAADNENGGISSPSFSAVTFIGNSAQACGAFDDYGYGGTGTPVLNGVVFTGNSATGNGGALCNSYANPTLTDVVFRNNAAGQKGGAVYNVSGNGTSVLTRVVFNGNSAGGNGGAVYDDSGTENTSSPTFVDVTFSGNSAGADGGAIYDYSGNYDGVSNPAFIDATFSDNRAVGNGGAIYDTTLGPNYTGSSNVTLSNATFSGNRANQGGAIYAGYGSGFTLTNATFGGNHAEADGSAFYNYHCGVTLTNVILWDDVSGGRSEIRYESAHSTLDHSILQGGCPAGNGYYTCTNVLTGNPLLGALANYGGDTRTLLPAAGSPAVNAGDNGACPGTDQRGKPRSDGHCDIGAVERQAVEDVIFNSGFDE